MFLMNLERGGLYNRPIFFSKMYLEYVYLEGYLYKFCLG